MSRNVSTLSWKTIIEDKVWRRVGVNNGSMLEWQTMAKQIPSKWHVNLTTDIRPVTTKTKNNIGNKRGNGCQNTRNTERRPAEYIKPTIEYERLEETYLIKETVKSILTNPHVKKRNDNLWYHMKPSKRAKTKEATCLYIYENEKEDKSNH